MRDSWARLRPHGSLLCNAASCQQLAALTQPAGQCSIVTVFKSVVAKRRQLSSTTVAARSATLSQSAPQAPACFHTLYSVRHVPVAAPESRPAATACNCRQPAAAAGPFLRRHCQPGSTWLPARCRPCSSWHQQPQLQAEAPEVRKQAGARPRSQPWRPPRRSRSSCAACAWPTCSLRGRGWTLESLTAATTGGGCSISVVMLHAGLLSCGLLWTGPLPAPLPLHMPLPVPRNAGQRKPRRRVRRFCFPCISKWAEIENRWGAAASQGGAAPRAPHRRSPPSAARPRPLPLPLPRLPSPQLPLLQGPVPAAAPQAAGPHGGPAGSGLQLGAAGDLPGQPGRGGAQPGGAGRRLLPGRVACSRRQSICPPHTAMPAPVPALP